jgi:hypothetical protein
MPVEVNSQTFSVTHSAFWSRTRELTSLSLFFKEARPQQLAKTITEVPSDNHLMDRHKRPRPANRFLEPVGVHDRAARAVASRPPTYPAV